MSVRRIIIHNPFDRSQRTIEDVELGPGMTPLSALMAPDDPDRVITLLNGEIIPPGERSLRLVKDQDNIVISPVLHGGQGGGGKGILRMIAMIAILAAAIVVPILIGPAGAALVGAMGASLIGAGISVGGALLMAALAPRPKAAITPATQDQSQTYGWAGPQMSARQGMVINKGYGVFEEAGNVLDSYIYTAQDQQWMNLLISFGWGPARSITQIKINSNPIENYRGIMVEKRLGFNEQDPVSFFNDVVNEFPQSSKLRADSGPLTFNGHGVATEAVEVEINCPKGLWSGPNPDGSLNVWSVQYKIEYSLHGSGIFTNALAPRTTADVGSTPQWLAIVQDQFAGGPNQIVVVATSNNDDHIEGEPGPTSTTVIPVDPNGTTLASETRVFRSTWVRNPLNDPNGISSLQGSGIKSVSDWSQISDTVSGNRTAPIRHVTRIDLPQAGQWDIRVTKISADNDSPNRGEDVFVTSIREFAHDALKYPNMVLLGIRALATDQLSGSGINITAVVDHGDPESLGYKHVVAADRPQAYYRMGAPGNLVANGSGEINAVSTLQATGWTFRNGNALVASSDFAKVGSNSLKLDNPSALDSFSSQDISVTDQHQYQLSGWIKTSALPSADAGQGAALNIDIVSGVTSFAILSKTGHDFNAAQPDVGVAADDAAHDWQQVQCTFKPNGSGIIRLYTQLGYGGAQSGTAWFDDIQLQDLSGLNCADSSGRGNNATYSATGVTFSQPGLIQSSANLAALFDGAGTTKITTPSLPLSTSYSIDLWINPSALGGMLAGNNSSGDGLLLDASGKLNLRYSGADHLSATALAINVKSHVAVVVSGGFVQFVINGVIDANTYSSATALTVDTLLKAFAGVADEVGIYAPAIMISRFRTRYLFGLSDRNKLEDFTGDQPATVCWDELTNALYGGKVDPADVDINAFIDWSNRCNEIVDDGQGGQMYRHSFNGVFDVNSNLLDSLAKTGAAGRASVILSGGRRYTVVQDMPASPVQLFTMGSIVKGSFKETWLALADRANSIDMQFSNSADGYKRGIVTVQDQDQITIDGEVRPSATIDFFGAITEAECVREGSYRLNSTKLLQRAIQFDADVEAIATQLGDVFYFSHDVPQWGISGRIQSSVDASHVTLERAVTMDPIKNYQLLCQLPTVKRFTGTISSISGLRVFINAWGATARVLRLVDAAATKDYAIQNSASGYVDLESVTGLTPGDSVDLWDLDVIEALPVVNTGNTTQAIQTTTPFSAQPQQNDMFAFGEVNLAAKAFRCVKISKAKDQNFTIFGAEYNDTVYADELPVIAGGANPKPTMDVNTLTADETFDLVGERWISFVRLGWRPGSLTVGADIFASVNGAPERFVDTVDNHSSYLLEATIGQTVLVRIVGFDVKGNRANYNTAPTITHTVTGVTTNMLINSTFKGSLAHWDVNWRAGDNIQRTISEGDGSVQYNVVGSTLAAGQKFLSQLSIDPSLWSIGEYLMLSGYVQSGGGATGKLALEIVFNGAGTTVRAEWDLATASNGLRRINTAATQVPGGTTSIDVIIRIRDAGSGVSVAVGKLITVDHLLLEVVAAGVTVPSKWADVDSGSASVDTIIGGHSGNLNSQASILPAVSGAFQITVTDTTITISWTNMKLRWPFKFHITSIQDDSYTVTGLTGSVAYTLVAFYDIVNNGRIKFVEGKTNSHGSPAGAYTTLGQDAIHAQIQDGNVPMGIPQATTNAPGNTTPTGKPDSGGVGGGSGGGPRPLGLP